MKILSLIPARMGSTRFPGKPMALIGGKPMIGRVYEQVAQTQRLTSVYVATCDEIIFDYIKSIGGNAVMTSNTHERASDRCAEALLLLEAQHNYKYDIVVMVQGDEPLINHEMIDEAIRPLLKDPTVLVSNLYSDIISQDEISDKNCIKVVCDLSMNAIYFSREAIPTIGKALIFNHKKQVCVIPFRRDFLLEYSKLSPTPLEISESVDMLRVLEHGFKVKMVKTMHLSQAVDTMEDLLKVESIILSLQS